VGHGPGLSGGVVLVDGVVGIGEDLEALLELMSLDGDIMLLHPLNELRLERVSRRDVRVREGSIKGSNRDEGGQGRERCLRKGGDFILVVAYREILQDKLGKWSYLGLIDATTRRIGRKRHIGSGG